MASTFFSLARWLSKPTRIIFLLCIYLLSLLVIFPQFSGDLVNALPIDLAFHYSSSEVYAWIEAYGEDGRKHYMLGEMTIDIIYPLVYTSLFIGLIGFLTGMRSIKKLRYSDSLCCH